LILERLHGRDFEDYLVERETRRARLGLSELVDLLTPVATTLESAHAGGILHRDLKPSNIFVTKAGGVRLLDFGFAKFISLRGLTRVGHVAGSPSYIAPEAWGGNPDKLDARVDVYGLAAVVFRALAARPPFQAPKVYDLFRMVTEAERPSLRQFRPDLPEDLDHWVELALAIDPNQRFSQIRALWTALSGIAARASEPPKKRSDAPKPPPRQRPVMSPLAFAPTDPPEAERVSSPVNLTSGDVLSLDDSSPAARDALSKSQRLSLPDLKPSLKADSDPAASRSPSPSPAASRSPSPDPQPPPPQPNYPQDPAQSPKYAPPKPAPAPGRKPTT
jgi:serine/threonine protein kinase